MDFLDCPHLSHAPYWADADDRRRIVVVSAVDAIRLCRHDGHEAVEPWEALWQFERLAEVLTQT